MPKHKSTYGRYSSNYSNRKQNSGSTSRSSNVPENPSTATITPPPPPHGQHTSWSTNRKRIKTSQILLFLVCHYQHCLLPLSSFPWLSESYFSCRGCLRQSGFLAQMYLPYVHLYISCTCVDLGRHLGLCCLPGIVLLCIASRRRLKSHLSL